MLSLLRLSHTSYSHSLYHSAFTSSSSYISCFLLPAVTLIPIYFPLFSPIILLSYPPSLPCQCTSTLSHSTFSFVTSPSHPVFPLYCAAFVIPIFWYVELVKVIVVLAAGGGDYAAICNRSCCITAGKMNVWMIRVGMQKQRSTVGYRIPCKLLSASWWGHSTCFYACTNACCFHLFFISRQSWRSPFPFTSVSVEATALAFCSQHGKEKKKCYMLLNWWLPTYQNSECRALLRMTTLVDLNWKH